jgi:hypothetical protein
MIGKNFGQAILAFGFYLKALTLDPQPFSSRSGARLYKLAVKLDQAQTAAVEFHGLGCAALNHLTIAPDVGKSDFSAR